MSGIGQAEIDRGIRVAAGFASILRILQEKVLGGRMGQRGDNGRLPAEHLEVRMP